MTNREWLESLTDEEFADWATHDDQWDVENNRPIGLSPHRKTIVESYSDSYGGILSWLKEERFKCEASPKLEHVKALPNKWYDPSEDGLYEKEASGKASFDCSAPDCLDCERNDECNHIGLFEEASE